MVSSVACSEIQRWSQSSKHPPLTRRSCQTKARLWSLELGGSFQKAFISLGAGRGHNCPEERALSWADGSTVTAPHGGGKRFLLSSSFAAVPAGPGRAGSGVGQWPWASGVRWWEEVWERWTCHNTLTHVRKHIHVCAYSHACAFPYARLLRQYRFYPDFSAAPRPTNAFCLSLIHCLTSLHVFAPSSPVWFCLSNVGVGIYDIPAAAK